MDTSPLLRYLAAAVAATVWLALGTAPAAAEASGERVFRLGALSPSRASSDATRKDTLPELSKLGFRVGHNLVLLDRFGPEATLPELMQDLLREKPDVIIAIGPDAVRSAAAATKTVPIAAFGPDLVQLGLAKSIARPGANVTGVTILSPELDAKRLDLLHQAVPSARRIAALMSTTVTTRAESKREMRKYASQSALSLHFYDAAGPQDYRTAFLAMKPAGVQALVIAASASFYRDAETLVANALEAKLPTVCEWSEMADMGCLIGYGPDRAELRRRLAHYVASIFGGAWPANLPIETPTHFELAINLKTARALNIEIPADLQLRANRLIE